MFARERLGSGWVLAGERGERWLVAGTAEASPHLAPESLLHILRPEPRPLDVRGRERYRL